MSKLIQSKHTLAEGSGEWRHLFAWGEVKHYSGDFAVDEKFATDMIEAFTFLRDTYNYYPPIIGEHLLRLGQDDDDPTADLTVEGAILGLVASLKVDDQGIWGETRWNKIGQALNENDMFLYLSPSFWPTWGDPHSDVEMENVLREMSMVQVPHQKNIEAPVSEIYGLNESGYVTNQADLSAASKGDSMGQPENLSPTDESAPEFDVALAEDEEEEEDPFAAFSDRIAAIEAVVFAEAEDEEEEDEEEEDEAKAEMSELRRKVRILENTAAVRKIVPNATDQEVQDLTELKIDKPKVYARVVKKFSDRGVEIGSQGSASHDLISMGEVKELAAYNALPVTGPKRFEFIQTNYPHLLND